MAKYRVQGPDGKVHVFEGPDGASPADVESFAAQTFGGKQAPSAPAETTLAQDVAQQGKNALGGLIRGAGSIGATLARPFESAQENEARRNRIDTNMADIVGADPNSILYKGGKIGGEIAGTAGAGGLIGNALSRIPTIASNAPSLINAIRSSGMTTGSAGGNALQNLAVRGAGGAISGGAQAAMVDPKDAATGAMIGGAAPTVMAGMGALGRAAGKIIKGPEQSADMVSAIKAARDAGYVIPPTQANPTLTNRLLEGFSGKLTTAQNASAKNADVTNSLAAKAIGLADDVKITPEVLGDVRKSAGQAYEAVASLPVKPAQQANSLTNTPAIAEINPRDMVFDLRKARNDADAWYKSYSRTADPDALVKAKAFKSEASKLESGLEDYATSIGRDDLVPAMVDARALIAKTHTIENALNKTTGAVDARKLGAMLDKGKPLTNELKQAAEFANRFPKAAQTVEKMGSLPQTSPLDWAAGGAISAATANPLALASVVARPAARALTLSNLVQNRLVNEPGQNALSRIASNPSANQLLYRSAPVAIR